MDTRFLHPATVAPVRHPKPHTWYYGARCVCARLLPICEDLFGGRGDDFLQMPETIAVECDCGTVSHVLRFRKFRTR
jgi:hypothetical protein